MEGRYVGVVLGHNPLLSISEVLSIYENRGSIVALDRDFCVLKEVEIEPLLREAWTMGGVPKIFSVFEECNKEILREVVVRIMKAYIEEKAITGKILFSLSVYGRDRKYQKDMLLMLKKTFKDETEQKVRFIHKMLDRNVFTAQLKTERIIENGLDVVICERQGSYFVGISQWVQDIDMYTKRDMGKPWRDMRNGILPPKLAQIMLHLTANQGPVWDPFCGSGVIPMEAVTANIPVVGSDLSDEMIVQSRENIEWLSVQEEYAYTAEVPWAVFYQDATDFGELPVLHGQTVERVVTEGFLGKNFSEAPLSAEVAQTQRDVLDIWKAFFISLDRAARDGFEVVLTLPIHSIKGTTHRLPGFFEMLQKSRFKVVPLLPEGLVKGIVDFSMRSSYTREGTLLYMREGQFVGREIVKCRRA